MKRTVILITMLMNLVIATQSHASLTVRGTDSLGNQLIYDSDLNVTWYDYTSKGPYGYGDTYANQVNWANNLSVSFNNTIYNGWRLAGTATGPLTGNGYDGTGNYGYNVTSNELGHLYYVELGNKGAYDKNGIYQVGMGLNNTGVFNNLSNYSYYWAGEFTPFSSDSAMFFYIGNGYLDTNTTTRFYYALAVLPGDVTPTPIPPSFLLMGSGLLGLVGFRKRGASKSYMQQLSTRDLKSS